jgi:ABC-type nitrate/sulfonate/bicarbonate transport system permease component
MAETIIPAPATDVRVETLVERLRRRARLVLALRLAVLVFLIGGWEVGVRAGLIDPFFFGQPSGIVEKLIDWFQNGTSIGPLWKQIWVTIYEAGAGFWQMTRAVVIPSALSWILASLHVSFGFALVGAIVGEFLGAREGMGLLIATAQGSFDSNGVFAAMIVIAVVALIAEWLLTMIEDRLLTWRPETTINE